MLKRSYRGVLNDYIFNGNEGCKGAPILTGLTPSNIGLDIKALSAKDTGLLYRNEFTAHFKSKGVVSQETEAKKDGRLIVTK